MFQRAGETVARLGIAMAVVGLVVGASACSEEQPAENEENVPAAPVTAGYESAIAAHAMKPIFRPNGTAPAVWGPGDRYNLAIVPTGGGPPPHIHLREDESFYVVSGDLEILIGDSTHKAKAGDFVFIPRGTVHRFKNLGGTTAVQLVTFVPAGMEQYFREVFPPVADPKAAPPPITQELIRKMHEAAAKYGLEFSAAPEGGTE